MKDRYPELGALLARVRRRWQALRVLQQARWAGLGSSLVLILALLVHRLVQPHGVALILLWTAALLAVAVAVVISLRPLRGRPRDLQIARLIEERCGDLDDSIATAVEQALQNAESPLTGAVIEDAVRRAESIDVERVISRTSLRRSAALAGAAVAAGAIAMVLSVPSATMAARAARLYIFPEHLALEVRPGNARVIAGESLQVVARVTNAVPVTPRLRVTDGSAWRDVPMVQSAGGYVATLTGIDQDFHYAVTAAGAASAEYAVTVLHRPRVDRIDLRYEYPAAFGMKPRVEEDGGDVYGPAGTRVRITVHPSKPVEDARLAMTGGAAIPLAWNAERSVLQGDLTIADDGSYRVALVDADGLENQKDTEYFIRTLQDAPPDVRITRPASDRQVTPLEEVPIEAQADDDFGVASLDLVYAVAGSANKVVPFTRNGTGTEITGTRMLYLEDLGVKPGDVVSYYARARDVSRGKRASESRSDIFFLEVKPFEEEFVASQSQGGGGTAEEQALEDLIQAEKDVITATWNLDRRSRESGGRSADDIRSVSKAQRDTRTGAERILTRVQRSGEMRRRRLPGGRGAAPAAPDAMAEALGRGVAAMANAQEQLDGLRTAEALPHEMTALNELLRAQAEVRRREIQQGGGNGGSGGNRGQQDMSGLFDRELARQQQTNYETPGGGDSRGGQRANDETANRVQELARRQEAVNRSEQHLEQQRSSMTAEQVKRELERLTREQSELRRQAEDLARSAAQNAGNGRGQGRSAGQGSGQGSGAGQGSGQGSGAGQGSGQSSGAGQASGHGGGSGQGTRKGGSADPPDHLQRELQQASEDMRSATSELRRDNPREASAQGNRAVERLRDLEQRLRGEQPGRQLSEELARLRQLREQLASLDREVAEMKKGGGGRGGGEQQGETGPPAGSGQGSRGPQAWNEARELLNELRRADDSLVPPEADGFNPGRSAPGTEAWKQDFAKWDELKVQLAAALERREHTTADRLRQEQSRDRLNTGASQAVPESYRRLVEKYYRALAAEGK